MSINEKQNHKRIRKKPTELKINDKNKNVKLNTIFFSFIIEHFRYFVLSIFCATKIKEKHKKNGRMINKVKSREDTTEEIS